MALFGGFFDDIFSPFKKAGREIERAGKRVGIGTKRVVESTLEETGRFSKTDVGIATITAATALIPGVGPFIAPIVGGGLALEQQKSLAARAARDQARLDSTISGTSSGGVTPGVTPGLPDIVQPTPLPGPGEVSVQLGTGQERARRRRSRTGSGRGRGRVFGGAGLLIPEAEIRRQTLGGF